MAMILCVDDEPAVSAIVEHALTRLGHQCRLCSSVEEALDAAARSPFDLILADYRMPKKTGLDLLHLLEAEGYRIPVIIMTGYSSVEHAVASIKSGAIDYLTKPITPEALEIAVTQALEVVRLRRENETFRRELQKFRATRVVVGESEPPTVRTAGAFERAHGGTLLLDEISEMRLDLQSKLLRVIQEQEFERVGGAEAVKVDVRLIATTNRDLKAETAAGRFRQDLYYRLNVVRIRTPPLRERPEDIPRLAQHFLQRSAEQLGLAVPPLPAETLALLQSYEWPGNVRELANAMERAVILARGGPLRPAEVLSHLDHGPPEPAAPGQVGRDVTDTSFDLDTLEHRAILRALEATGGNRVRAAKLLGISERTLRNKLKVARPPQAS